MWLWSRVYLDLVVEFVLEYVCLVGRRRDWIRLGWW